ncbi:MAG: hypothetical protein AB7G93_18840 [Bdellovibrionales bacterium]
MTQSIFSALHSSFLENHHLKVSDQLVAINILVKKLTVVDVCARTFWVVIIQKAVITSLQVLQIKPYLMPSGYFDDLPTSYIESSTTYRSWILFLM